MCNAISSYSGNSISLASLGCVPRLSGSPRDVIGENFDDLAVFGLRDWDAVIEVLRPAAGDVILRNGVIIILSGTGEGTE